jgi:hypothetical protein
MLNKKKLLLLEAAINVNNLRADIRYFVLKNETIGYETILDVLDVFCIPALRYLSLSNGLFCY